MWYLRITHTRLADSILELCGVPQDETLRHFCQRIFTLLSAPAPDRLCQYLPDRQTEPTSRASKKRDGSRLEELLSEAKQHGLPASSSHRLRSFIRRAGMPLPVDVHEAIEALQTSLNELRKDDAERLSDPKLLKRVEDFGRSLAYISSLVDLMHLSGASPLLGSKRENEKLNRPLFLSIDLGLKQRRKHYHGQILFQCISVPDNYFEQPGDRSDGRETNDVLLSPYGQGSKFAEGGRYDDLVRKYRPPGNFGSACFDFYTTAPIPKVSYLVSCRG